MRVAARDAGVRGPRPHGGRIIDLLIAIAIPIWIVSFAALSGYLADRRRRSATVWTAFGAILGPVAAILVSAAPPGRCLACGTAVTGWSPTCVTCGRDVRVATAEEGRLIPPGTAPSPAAPPTMAAAPTRPVMQATPMAPIAPSSPMAPVAPVPPVAGSAAQTGSGEPPMAAPTGSWTQVAPRASLSPRADATPALAPLSMNDHGSPTPSPLTTAYPPFVPMPSADDEGAAPDGRLGSGVFVTGEVGLQPGDRYSFHIEGRRMLFREVTHHGSARVASQRQLRTLDANRVGDRLVITTTGARGPRTLMVFMSLESPGADAVATAIHDAAAQTRGDAT